MTIQSLKPCVLAFGLGILSVLPVHAQQYQFNNNSGSQEQKTTDPRNRARIHTELAALYFQ
ncbi:MAG: type IV pilus biogenesis/stability protein PilW, partial [Dechloromonas sp.]|nr:type IV pilus biogenesis/stability protein PilW [Dechloromonas sp.]